MYKYVIFGDATSPHLLKWARILNKKVDLYVASSTFFSDEWDDFLPSEKRLCFFHNKKHSGGNISILFNIFRLYKWISVIQPTVVNPHYLTSHGFLVVLLKTLFRAKFCMVSSAWGSDILVTPNKNLLYQLVTSYILRHSDLCTSDSTYMSDKMKKLGTNNIYTFFFGLLKRPDNPYSYDKEKWLFFSNRGLENIYQPFRVLSLFQEISKQNNDAQLVIANKGSLEKEMRAYVEENALTSRVTFVGYLSEEEQQYYYKKSQWYFSLPESDSGSVSLLEAMSFGCIPILSDLPANREIIDNNGLIIRNDNIDIKNELEKLILFRYEIIDNNYKWILENGLFEQSIDLLLDKINNLS